MIIGQIKTIGILITLLSILGLQGCGSSVDKEYNGEVIAKISGRISNSALEQENYKIMILWQTYNPDPDGRYFVDRELVFEQTYADQNLSNSDINSAAEYGRFNLDIYAAPNENHRIDEGLLSEQGPFPPEFPDFETFELELASGFIVAVLNSADLNNLQKEDIIGVVRDYPISWVGNEKSIEFVQLLGRGESEYNYELGYNLLEIHYNQTLENFSNCSRQLDSWKQCYEECGGEVSYEYDVFGLNVEKDENNECFESCDLAFKDVYRLSAPAYYDSYCVHAWAEISEIRPIQPEDKELVLDFTPEAIALSRILPTLGLD